MDGVVDILPTLDLSLDDRELLESVHRRVENSKNYWDDPQGHNLYQHRIENVRMHLGRHIEESRLYQHQIPYVDNQIFVGVESIVAYVSAKPAQADVSPARYDDIESRTLACDLEKVFECHSNEHNLDKKMECTTRDLLLKRIGLIKFVWDENYGPNGDIVPLRIDPAHVIIDKNAPLGENPEFICHILKASVSELVSKFPSKKKEIYDQLRIRDVRDGENGETSHLGDIVVYREVWFTYYQDNKPGEAVMWYFGDLILDKKKNPNYLYEKPQSNILPYPIKPFVPINFINDGSHWIDQTTPVEQAANLQQVLNKRGRQIMENADTANGVQVFAGDYFTMEDAENLTGDPNQKIVVAGSDVSKAMINVPPHFLPSFVLEDKRDMSNTVHAMLGTPTQFTGTSSGSQATLGQDLMQRNQAQMRQDAIVRCIDRAMDTYYKYLAQMMKVYYDDPHYFTHSSANGTFDNIEMTSDKIESGAKVSVRSGSFLPHDKQRAQAVALQLAQLGLISPYDLYSDLGLDDPHERFDNWLKFKLNPSAMTSQHQDYDADRDATVDFIDIMAGKDTKPRDDVEAEHLLAHSKQLVSDKFLMSDPMARQALLAHIDAEKQSLARRTQLLSTMAMDVQSITAPPMPMMPPTGAPGAPQGQQSQVGGGAMPTQAPSNSPFAQGGQGAQGLSALAGAPGIATPTNPEAIGNLNRPGAMPTM
jgi:hypothetical protein